MKISTRILLGYFLIVGLAAWFVLSVFIEEVKPGVREAMEDNLVDTANLLAELAAPDLAAGRIDSGDFARAVRDYPARTVDATIWGVHKRSLDYRVYVTDAAGRVVFDSAGTAVGQDYARWNDVYLTLRGRYGARTTEERADDANSSVMHVAAAVRRDGRIIGVLTVAKPNSTVQPFVERAQRKIRQRGALLLVAAALIGAFFTWRLTRSINRLRVYARDVSAGKRVPLPETGNSEIAELGRALEAMRERLDGKLYVEEYVHTLTHEMKSPLAAIRGAAELLTEDLPVADRLRFAANVREQSDRLHAIAEKMLALATLEHRQALQDAAPVDVPALVLRVLDRMRMRFLSRGLGIDVEAVELTVRGEAFLLEQALTNLIENAIDFSPEGGRIDVGVQERAGLCEIGVADRGPGVPDFALPRVFERFYSLPRPHSGKKSTGLGLALVREVAALHGGRAELDNRDGGGAIARLLLPIG